MMLTVGCVSSAWGIHNTTLTPKTHGTSQMGRKRKNWRTKMAAARQCLLVVIAMLSLNSDTTLWVFMPALNRKRDRQWERGRKEGEREGGEWWRKNHELYFT